MEKTKRRKLGIFAALTAAAAGLVVANTQAADAVPPEVFAGFRNSAIVQGTTLFTTQLNVPAGSYAITAKLSAFAGGAAQNYVETCTLRAGNDFDRSFTRLAGPSPEQGLSHNLVHTFTAPGAIVLECRASAPDAATLLEFIKITATRVNSISNVAI